MPGPRQRHQNSESGRANQRAHEERIARRAAEREATQQVRGRGRGQQQEDRGQRQQDIPSGRGQDHQQQGYLQDQGRGRQQRDQGHQQQGFQPSQGQGQYPDSGCSQAAPDVTLSPRSSPPFPSPVNIGPSAPDRYLYPGTPFQVLNPSYTQRPLPEPASAPRQLPKTPPPPVVAFSPGTEAVSRSFDVPK